MGSFPRNFPRTLDHKIHNAGLGRSINSSTGEVAGDKERLTSFTPPWLLFQMDYT